MSRTKWTQHAAPSFLLLVNPTAAGAEESGST
jgi:hypothetical protein